MERIIYRKTLDVHKSGIQFTLQGFQTADNMSRTVELSLMASGDTIDLPLEQLLVLMYVTTPNAESPSIIECTIKDNTIVCDIPAIVTAGITEIKLKLIETRPEGAKSVLATPKFAIEVSESDMDEEGATQSTTFTPLENALAQAKAVYDSRVTNIVLSPDCIFSVYYADGTVYTNDALRDVIVNGESLVSKSYARGGTGVRAGEDTDNSMYYSNVSKSASVEASRISGEATELLQEVTKHGVYTAFSCDFEKGELEYVSPMYKFEIDKVTGELNVIGEAYTFEKNINRLISKYIDEHSEEYDNHFETLDDNFETLSGKVSNISIEDTSYSGCFYRMVDGNKEWINPPLHKEVIYRTTERHGANPIYTRIYEIGSDDITNLLKDDGELIANTLADDRIVVTDYKAWTDNYVLPYTIRGIDGDYYMQVDVKRNGEMFYRQSPNLSIKPGYIKIQLWFYYKQ